MSPGLSSSSNDPLSTSRLASPYVRTHGCCNVHCTVLTAFCTVNARFCNKHTIIIIMLVVTPAVLLCVAERPGRSLVGLRHLLVALVPELVVNVIVEEVAFGLPRYRLARAAVAVRVVIDPDG